MIGKAGHDRDLLLLLVFGAFGAAAIVLIAAGFFEMQHAHAQELERLLRASPCGPRIETTVRPNGGTVVLPRPEPR